MKIGFDAKRYFQNSTGLGNYSRWVVDSLAKRNSFDYHLYHPKELSQKVELPTHHPEGINSAVPSLWRTRFVCARLEEDGMDIFHGLSNELPFGIHKTNVKSVVTIHDLINKRYPENYSPVDRVIYNRKLHYAQKHADKIIVPSAQTSEDLTLYFGTPKSKIEIIPLAYLPRKTSILAETAQSPYILCVSSFDKRKNLVRLVKAFHEADCNHKLVICGKKGNQLSRVKKIIKDLKANVEVKTNVDNKELNLLYSGALFCVYPSYFEGFGIPILEAFSYGKAVATSAISSMPEVGGNAAVYFDPNITDSMTAAITKLLIDSEREKIETNIKQQLTLFESDKLIKRYESLYEGLIT